MEEGRVESLKNRLKFTTSWTEYDLLIKEIADLGNLCPREILELTIANIKNSKVPSQELLTDLVIKLDSKELYFASKKHLIHSYRLCAELMKAGIPDPDIENAMISRLLEFYKNDQIHRKEVVKALKDYGSITSLKPLKAIEYELHSIAQVGKIILTKSDSKNEIDFEDMTDEDKKKITESFLANLNRQIQIDFYNLVKDAITVITERNCEAKTLWIDSKDDLEKVLPKTHISNVELLSLIKKGESRSTEFKQTLSLNLKNPSPNKDPKLEEAVYKTIAGFLNTLGGVLIVGVDDSGEILGINHEIEKFHKNNLDTFLKHFRNLISTKIGAQFYTYILYDIVQIDSKNLLVIDCKPSQTPVFINNDSADFYIRSNPATELLKGAAIIQYIKNHFPNHI
jgi:hypothetical protein